MLVFVRVLRRLELFAKLEAFRQLPFSKISVNKMAARGSFFTVLCVIRRYHYYTEVWSPNDNIS